jgi:dsDNA-specific endonuclease/ATPase MutS2
MPKRRSGERENKRLNEEWTARFEENPATTGRSCISEAAVEAKKLIAQARKKAAEILDEAQTNTPADASEKAARKRRIDTAASEATAAINEKIPAHPLHAPSGGETAHVFRKGDGVYLPDVKADGVILDIEKARRSCRSASSRQKCGAFQNCSRRRIKRRKNMPIRA